MIAVIGDINTEIWISVIQFILAIIGLFMIYEKVERYFKNKKIQEVRYEIEEAIKFKLTNCIQAPDYVLNSNDDDVDRMISKLSNIELLKLIGGYNGFMYISKLKTDLMENEELTLKKYEHMKKYLKK